MSQLEWSELGVSGLPTGTVTLLLADVEGSTRLWETQPAEMTAAIARLDAILWDLVAAHAGVRPVEQGEGDSFVVAFARASDAIACALALQRAPLAPIRLRIGVNTGEIQLRSQTPGEANYVGPTINRTARLRDLGHGGQTLLSGATESMVLDHLPDDAWLNDLGTHRLRDLPRPERVVQLCHPDIRNEFPQLRTSESEAARRLPPQLTSFVGRQAQLAEVRELLTDNRLVTLTGAGGSGKTRLALRIASELGDDVRYVDLAPIADADLVVVAVARAFGLPDQPGRSTMDTIARAVGDRPMLLVLDNCEHLLDASAALIVALLEVCPGITLLTTSREPVGLPSEVTWRVPSLSIADEALELFEDRARRVRPDFTVADDSAEIVAEICARLDGMPLAIELAAARIRALSLTEIRESLHDRFRLLTGGSRRAVRRQQSLGASVDWSHALLTEPERILFRRLAAFIGGFDLEAAQNVCGGGALPRHQILDQLTLLVDKSLVVAETTRGRTRYRLLETIRQYALEKLAESGEADVVRESHRDHYAARAAQLDVTRPADHEHLLDQAEIDIDNLRAAFGWSLEHGEIERAARLATDLYPLWILRYRPAEGVAWFDAVFADMDERDTSVGKAIRARALADSADLDSLVVRSSGVGRAEEAVAIARELGDRVLLARALTSCICAAAFDVKSSRPYIAEAIEVSRELGDDWRLCQALAWQSFAASLSGHPVAAAIAGSEGRPLADAVGDRFMSLMCRYWGDAIARYQSGEVAACVGILREIMGQADASSDEFSGYLARVGLGHALLLLGEYAEARVLAERAVDAAQCLGQFLELWAYAPLAKAALACGDIAAARRASDLVWQRFAQQPELAVANVAPMVELAYSRGDLDEARRWADEAVSAMTGWHLTHALTTRGHVAIAQNDLEQAESDARQALSLAVELQAYQDVPDALEILVQVGSATGGHRDAARLVGAAATVRAQQGGTMCFPIYQPGYEAALEKLRDTLGQNDFDSALVEGAALSLEEAIAYAQRGRGARKRPSSGWHSLTPTELDVVRLVREGLGNKDIATRLFMSHRTVQTHLTHVYAKLGLASRVQLAQEAAHHG